MDAATALLDLSLVSWRLTSNVIMHSYKICLLVLEGSTWLFIFFFQVEVLPNKHSIDAVDKSCQTDTSDEMKNVETRKQDSEK